MADLSPEFASEIQKLEANYASNPGRFFVPLASKWRDAGDVAMAERILRENIGKFPGLSAHVLLGRCLADRGAFPEAANEFHYVLSIDSQNLIALRTLAEMAAAGGKRSEAERWYNELLAVDPMNAEARAALAQLARAGTAPAEPSASAEPGWGDVGGDVGVATIGGGGGDEGGEFGMIDLDVPDASPADASGVAADEPADGGMAAWGDLTLDASPAPEPTSGSAGSAGGDLDGFGFVDLETEPASADASPEWTDVDARQDVGQSAAADLGDLPLLDDGMIDAPLAGADLPFIDADADAGATVDDGGFGGLAGEPGAGFGFGEPAPAAADHVFHEADGHDADAEMVTETMAELYASQGLLAQAADVYRELIGQRGQEPGLVRRLGEIEARIAGGPVEAAPLDDDAGAPDWLESVDAFARGGAEPDRAEFDIDGGLPALDLTPASSDAFSFGTEPDASDFGAEPEAAGFGAEPDAAEFSIAEPAPSAFSAVEPVAPSASGDPFADSFSAGFDGAAEPVAADAGSADWAGAFSADAGTATSADAGAGSADRADAFSADAGAEPLPADVGAADGGAADGAAEDRQAWEAPTVAETEPVGFDILVVADEDGGEVPASPEVVADVSADWAIAAAPLDDDDEEEPAVPIAAAAPAYTPPAPGVRTMRGYFSSLLTWQPVPAETATYEISAEGGTLTIEAAEPDAPSTDAPGSDEAPSAAPSFDAPAADATPSFDAAPSAEPAQPVADEEPAPWEAAAPPPAFPAAPDIPTFQAPAFQPPAFAEPEAPAAGDDEPWAAASAEDEPWAAPGESAPAASGEPAPADLPLLDLEEPWAETPAAPVDIASFELAEDAAPAPAAEPTPSAEPASAGTDAQAEELLPWEVPADPAAAPQAPAASDAGGGFSFEDFFSGTPSAPAAPSSGAAEPPPEPPVRAAETPAFIPSFAEPTPPPVFEAPAPPPAPAAPPAAAAAAPQAGGQDEDDEDLESFQAWLQSLKR